MWKGRIDEIIQKLEAGEITLEEARKRNDIINGILYLAENGLVVDAKKLTAAEKYALSHLRRLRIVRLILISRTRARFHLNDHLNEEVKEHGKGTQTPQTLP